MFYLKYSRFFKISFTFLLLVSTFSVILPTWVREKGRFLLYTDLSYRSDNQYLLKKDEIISTNNFSEIGLSSYLDYGVTGNYTLGIYFPFLKKLSFESPDDGLNGNYSSMGDLDFIQRFQFASIGGAVFNLELLIGIPLGIKKHDAGFPLGDAEYNVQTGISTGWGFALSSLPSYLTFYTGYNKRNAGFSDEWHNSFQWGLFVYKKELLLSLELKSLASLENESDDFSQRGLQNNISYLAYGGGITYKFNEDSGISFYYKTLAQVENTVDGEIFSVGGFYLY